MTDQRNAGGIQSAVWLTIIMVIGWAVCFWPARMLNGQAGVAWMTLACVCCLVPGWIVVFLTGLAIFPNELAVMLGQFTVRFCLVGGAAVVVKVLQPDLKFSDFFGWLTGFYLVAMTAEVWMLWQAKERTRRSTTEAVPGRAKDEVE